MRRLIITQNMTLDGSIDMLEPWFDPAAADPELTSELQRQQAGADALLLGRQTFEDFRSYWPHRDDDTTGTADYLNRVAKYVVSATLDEPGWAGTTVLRGHMIDEVDALKSQPGQDIVCTGSVALCHSMISAGMVDEYRLFVYPFVQGRGRRLFPDGYSTGGLTPAAPPVAFDNGVTLVRWRQVR